MPTFFEMDLISGQIDYFGYIDFVDQEADHQFFTFGGIHLDAKDPKDGESYIYASFIHNDDLEIVKIKNSDKTIKWHYQFHTDSTAIGANLKEPMFILPD